MLSALVLGAMLLGPLASTTLADEGEGPLDKAQPAGRRRSEIIQRFAAKEKEFKAARDQYTYRQDVKVQTLDGDTMDGEYHQVFDVTFDDQGHKVKNVVFAPQNTLERIMMTEEDMDDIENRLPFVLTSDEIPEYNILYVGQQQEDELHCYVFDIAPKEIVGKKRYFQGRIWVDDHDFQIVKTYGKTVPDIRKKKGNENLFPQLHHLARADGQQVLVSHLHQGRRPASLFWRRRSHSGDCEVRGLQEVRREREDHISGEGYPEGRAAAESASGPTEIAVSSQHSALRRRKCRPCALRLFYYSVSALPCRTFTSRRQAVGFCQSPLADQWR